MGRRVPRFPCKASAEVTSGGAIELTNITELSRYGCFLQTPTPLATGTSLAVKIMNQGKVFAATAPVINRQLRQFFQSHIFPDCSRNRFCVYLIFATVRL